MGLHTSVLLNEAVDALVGDPAGIYVDATYGRGGHSRMILSRLAEEGRLLGIDKDLLANADGHRLEREDKRFSMYHNSFAELAQLLDSPGLQSGVDGVLADLGVSSPQLDSAERGFSFASDGPLDMRMDTSAGITAADWVNTAPEQEVEQVLREYGEERFARRMARAIVTARQQAPIERTLQLAGIIADANPAWEKGKHPATRAFQAIRIRVNQELQDLQDFLQQALQVLKPGGRLVVISFHSLEDRMVKRFIREQERGPRLPRGLPVTESQIERRMRAVGKAIKAGAQEVAANHRARSAVMRVAEKL